MVTMVTREDALQAQERIGDVISPTPLAAAYGLERRLGRLVWLKCEMLQRTGSFKSRGALNWIRTATREELDRGLITVSAGNHAQALAWAAQAAGVPVTVVMPHDASPVKVEATRAYGAEVVLHGEIADALAKMDELRTSRGLSLVHPFDDPRIIAGQGTVGVEIMDQLPETDVIVCPIGGGGLISGIAVVAKTIAPQVRVIGVEPAGAATMSFAWECGGPRPLPGVQTVAPSLGALVAGEHTYAMTKQYVDDIVTLSEEEIVEGFIATVLEGKVYAEPGGSVSVAAIMAGKVPIADGERAVAVVSGGNLDLSLLRSLVGSD